VSGHKRAISALLRCPQVRTLSARGHYAYYGVAGNIRALQRVHRFVECYWRKMLCSRSWAGRHLTWPALNRLKEGVPLLRPRLRLPYRALQVATAPYSDSTIRTGSCGRG